MDTAKQNACMKHDLVVPNSGEGDILHEDTSDTVSDDLCAWLVVSCYQEKEYEQKSKKRNWRRQPNASLAR